MLSGKGDTKIRDGAIEFISKGLLSKFFSDRGWGAFSFGWLIIYWGKQNYNNTIACHERVHLMQGIKYSIAYHFIYLFDLITKGYRGVRFEVQAYDLAYKLNKQKDLKINDYY